MATKSGSNASGEKVTRISANDAPKKVSNSASKTVKAEKVAKAENSEKTTTRNPLLKTLFAIGGYFRGAWIELRLVRWPTRRATWGLTFAVLLFTAFFVVVILLLDILFKYLFEQILK